MIYLASLACVIVMGAGFIVLHFALIRPTTELRVAGWTLIIGAVSILIFMVMSRDCIKYDRAGPAFFPMRQEMGGGQCHKAPAPQPAPSPHHKPAKPAEEKPEA